MVVVISYGRLCGCRLLLEGLWVGDGFSGEYCSLPKGPCAGTMGLHVPSALKMTPRKIATDLQIPWHDLARFCCAKFCRSEFGLFLMLPPPVSAGEKPKKQLPLVALPCKPLWPFPTLCPALPCRALPCPALRHHPQQHNRRLWHGFPHRLAPDPPTLSSTAPCPVQAPRHL